VDLNVHWAHWPRGFWPWKTLGGLVKALKGCGITRALISSPESILYPDPVETDRILLTRIKPFPFLTPVATLNPAVLNFQKQIAGKDFVAFRLVPAFWDCSLKEKTVRKLLTLIQERKRLLLIQMRLEDERSQFYPLQVPAPKITDLLALAKNFPSVKMVVLNVYFDEAVQLARQPNVWVDLSFLERFQTLKSLLTVLPVEKVVFGSHAPFLYPEAALAKVMCARIPERVKGAILFRNSQRWLSIG
ncbi:MAG TPA: amidohydrolase family protein, partial [bacterium]|nr:amidohydrolase family protein [bacterium]